MTRVSRRDFMQGAMASAVMATGLTMVPAAMGADEVQMPKDPKNLQPGLEAAHTPRIMLERADCKDVAYGKTPEGDLYKVNVQARHEATKEHYISSKSPCL